ncbi:MAG: serine/threonine-protein kinase, partial [Planctomycetia bacterium]|nr:serine/threonine-protein kinase [Planctomycetia bacterium]
TPLEPLTATAGTHTQAGEPITASQPRAEAGTETPPAPPGYVIVRKLGSGGMGLVYEGRQIQLNRPVALKVLHSGRTDAKDIVRFLAEAEAIAAVKHPHVVQVYDIGQDSDRPFMALELLTGGTLADRLKDGPLDPRDSASLVAKLADAVRAAHDLGIVHRDLKPSNILFENAERGTRNAEPKSEDSPGEVSSHSAFRVPRSALVPKVTDFGLAKRSGGVELTRTQAVMGTPAYMAPEQARGDNRFVGPSADIWALGVILYECLTGKRPFDADDTLAVLRKVTDESPASPRAHVPGLPRDLELIALKCLEKQPADRYPSAAALGDDLTRFLEGKPVSVRPAGVGERFVKWCRRNPVVACFSAALVFVALLGFAGVTWGFLKAESRGKDLVKANDNLNTTLDDLTKSRNDLAKANKGLIESADALGKSQAQTKQQAEDAEARGYLSDVALAHQLWKANDLAGMRGALARCPEKRRKWEWHYLNGISRPERVFHITDSPPVAVAYSPNGKLLAYFTISGTLYVRDIEAERDRHLILGDANQLTRLGSLAFSPSGAELAYILNGRVRVVDLATGKWRELKDPKQPDGNPGNRNNSPAVAVCYTPEGQLLAAVVMPSSVGDKPRMRSFAIRDAGTSKEISALPGFEEPEGVFAEIASAAFSPDGKLFAASAVDSGVRIGTSDKPLKELPAYTPRVFVWEVKSGKLMGQTVAGSSLLGSIAFDPESRVVGFGRRSEVGELTPNPTTSSRLTPAHTGDVPAIAFDRNGLIWSGGEDKMILAHDRKTGTERFALRGCSRGVLRLAVSPDGKEVVAGVGDVFGTGGAVYRFDVAALSADSWLSSAKRDRINLIAALAPDGARFAALEFSPFDGRPETIRFVMRDLADSKERVVTPAARWIRGAFAPDGRLFLAHHRDVRVIESDGKPSHTIELPSDPMWGGNFPPI